MNEKVPLEQAKVFRAVDPETSYSVFNAEKLVSFKLINGLAQVIPVTVVANDLVDMLQSIKDSISTDQQSNPKEKVSIWDSVLTQTEMIDDSVNDMTESNTNSVTNFKAKRPFVIQPGITDRNESSDKYSEQLPDNEDGTLTVTEVAAVDEKADSSNKAKIDTEQTEHEEKDENSDSQANESTTTMVNAGNSKESSSTGSGRANPDDLLGFNVAEENDDLDNLDRQASEDLAKTAKQQNDAIVDKRAEEILAERQAYVDDSKIDDQVIEDLNKQKNRTSEERRAEHQKWAEEALNNNKTLTI